MSSAGSGPLYLQIEQVLRSAIQEGRLYPRGTLPPERDLARDLGVARATVRKALRQLEEDGLLRRHKGSGTYVSPPIEQPLTRPSGFTQDMSGRGLKAGVIWLSRSRGLPTAEESFGLGLSPAHEVSRLERVRTVEGEPLVLELAVLPASVLPDPQSVEQSLYTRLAELGIYPVRALQRLKAGLASEREAKHLNIPPGSAVMHLQRIVYVQSQPIEFTRSTYRGDRYEFSVELKG